MNKPSPTPDSNLKNTAIDLWRRSFLTNSISIFSATILSTNWLGLFGKNAEGAKRYWVTKERLRTLKEKRLLFTWNVSYMTSIWLRGGQDSLYYHYLVDEILWSPEINTIIQRWNDNTLIQFVLKEAKKKLSDFRKFSRFNIYPKLRSEKVMMEIMKRVGISKDEYWDYVNTILTLLDYSDDAYKAYKQYWYDFLQIYANFRTEFEMKRKFGKPSFFERRRWKSVLKPWFQEVVDKFSSRQERDKVTNIFRQAQYLSYLNDEKNSLKVYDVAPLYGYCRPKSVAHQKTQFYRLGESLMEEKNINIAIEYYHKYKKQFLAAEKKYKISVEIILATLLKETKFWDPEVYEKLMIHNAFAVISTQISDLFVPVWTDLRSVDWRKASRRINVLLKNRAIWYLEGLFKYAFKNDLDIFKIKSNKVGAMWIPQFMPNNYIFAVDWNWDWKIDLNNYEDAIASIGNFYHKNNGGKSIFLWSSDTYLVNRIKVYNQRADAIATLAIAKKIQRSLRRSRT